jgi:hypothetical protein
MRIHLLASICLLALAGPVAGQAPPSPQALIGEQRTAMAKLAFMDGVWRGPAWTITPEGRHEVIQTERIGPFLDGSVKVIEGRGYNPDGSVGFNAFGIISWDRAKQSYAFHSYAQGHSGDFPFKATEKGYEWEVPAGPNAIIRYTAVVADGAYRETGQYVAGDSPPRQIFEMNLKRVGGTGWPAADPVPMR